MPCFVSLGDTAADLDTRGAPRRFRRCRGRRSRSSRRKTADGPCRARRIAPPGKRTNACAAVNLTLPRYDSTMQTLVMSKAPVRPREPDADGCVVRVTPESAGWRYVGFGSSTRCQAERSRAPVSFSNETRIVILSGRIHLRAGGEEWRDRGDREITRRPSERALRSAAGAMVSGGGRYVGDRRVHGPRNGWCRAPVPGRVGRTPRVAWKRR